jgi:hypothetical protein
MVSENLFFFRYCLLAFRFIEGIGLLDKSRILPLCTDSRRLGLFVDSMSYNFGMVK